MKTVFRLCLALVLAACTAAFAAGSADAIGVADATVRLMPPGARATAAFMTLKNAGDKDAKLVKVDCAAAKVAELHNHINDNGVMKMRQVPAIEIKAKGETRLAPGGYHLMLIEPAAMKEGDKIAITLGFEDGSSKRIEAVARKPEAAPPRMDHAGHDHKH